MTPKSYIENLHSKSTHDLQNAIQRNAPDEHIQNIEDKLRVLKEILAIIEIQKNNF